MLNKYLYFNGVNTYVDLVSPYNTNTFTIEAWTKISEIPNSESYILGNVENSGYGMYFSNDSTLRCLFHINGSYKDIQIPANKIKLNRWTHVAATYDGEYAKLYLNGKQETEVSVTGDITNSSYNMSIGSNLGRTRTGYFRGYIYDARVWNVARTEEQIRNNAVSLSEDDKNGLVARALLNEGSGSVAKEEVSGSDITISNPTWIEMKDYPLIIFESVLVKFNDQYHYYDGENWIPTTNTEEDYLTKGMPPEFIETIPEDAWMSLTEPTISFYTNDPFREEVIIETETKPFTLKDEMGDSMKVLCYVPNQDNQTNQN